MTREQQIEYIRKACIEANPVWEENPMKSLSNKRIIRLADVLLAIEKSQKYEEFDYCIAADGHIFELSHI
jgi:hypothetical protein